MGKYTEQREKYFKVVIARYSEGMTAKDITKTIPVSKSTVYRWVEEHFGAEGTNVPTEMTIPRTPASVAKTIKAMALRISQLEKQIELLKSGSRKPETDMKYEEVVKFIVATLKKSEII